MKIVYHLRGSQFITKGFSTFILFLSLAIFTSACNHGARDVTTLREDSKVDIIAKLRLISDKKAIATAWHESLGSEKFLVAEQQGVVWQFTYNSATQNYDEKMVLDVSDDTEVKTEQGFFGLVFSPDGKWLYISYSNSDTKQDEDFVAPNIVQAINARDLNSENPKNVQRRTIITIPQQANVHNGGDIAFSPKDGHLYISLGEGGNGTHWNSQSFEELNGSILRIAPTPETGGYEIPKDNPLINDSNNNIRKEIWAYGVRNAWRITFNNETGDLWVNDVGNTLVEEVNLLPNGVGQLNLGWAGYEGSQRLINDVDIKNHHSPIFEYEHTVAKGTQYGRCAITGGQVYNGKVMPSLRGNYIYADYCVPGAIWTFDPDNATNGKVSEGNVTLIVNQPSTGSIINFGVAPSGEVIVGTQAGTFLLEPLF